MTKDYDSASTTSLTPCFSLSRRRSFQPGQPLLLLVASEPQVCLLPNSAGDLEEVQI